MGDAGDDQVGLGRLDLVVDRGEVARIRREPDVLHHLEPGLGQAFLVGRVQRTGPGGVLAHDRGGFRLEQPDQRLLGRVADRLRQGVRSQVAVEGVAVARVVLVDGDADLVGGGPRRDHRGLEPGRPRHQGQHDLGDVAGDDEVDLVLADRPLERADRVGGGTLVVVGHDLDLAPVDPALGVDLVGGELDRLRDRGAGHRLRLGDHADLERVGRAGLSRQDQPRSEQRGQRAPNRGAPSDDAHGLGHRRFLIPSARIFYSRAWDELYPRKTRAQGPHRDRAVTFRPSRFPPGVSTRAAPA